MIEERTKEFEDKWKSFNLKMNGKTSDIIKRPLEIREIEHRYLTFMSLKS